MANGAAGYTITIYDAPSYYQSDTAAMDASMGLDPLVVESFDDSVFEPGIAANLQGGVDAAHQSWDTPLTSSASSNAVFTISLPGIRSFGIGVGDNDGGGDSLTINGGSPIALNTVPNFYVNGGGRAYYLKIEAQPGDADIAEVTISGVTLVFDHLTLGLGSIAVPESSGRLLWGLALLVLPIAGRFIRR